MADDSEPLAEWRLAASSVRYSTTRLIERLLGLPPLLPARSRNARAFRDQAISMLSEVEQRLLELEEQLT